MVGTTGFEPATSASRTQRSTKLSYVPTHGELFLEAKPAHLGEQVISKTNRTRVRCGFGLIVRGLSLRPKHPLSLSTNDQSVVLIVNEGYKT